jgi:UDP-N-acetylglucosamine 1-carboxyvinyltransferase
VATDCRGAADGSSLITENIFDGRFMFVNEMARLGADIRTDGHHAVVRGREWLSGAPVRATDIRAGAGLVIAGLCARASPRSVRCTTSTAGTRTSSRTWPSWASRWNGQASEPTFDF